MHADHSLAQDTDIDGVPLLLSITEVERLGRFRPGSLKQLDWQQGILVPEDAIIGGISGRVRRGWKPSRALAWFQAAGRITEDGRIRTVPDGGYPDPEDWRVPVTRYLSIPDVAVELDTSTTYVHILVRRGKLPEPDIYVGGPDGPWTRGWLPDTIRTA